MDVTVSASLDSSYESVIPPPDDRFSR
jgi:hypothetical protein